jgi:exosortase family protein XrtF
MDVLATLRSNRRVLAFFAKVLVAYVAWYALYDLWLLPDGRLDAALSHNVAQVAGALLSGLGFDVFVQGRSLMLPGVRGIYVADGCNGLGTIGLFIGFVVAYPGRWARRLWFIPLGIGLIYLTNVVRTAVMLLVQKFWPAAFVPLHGFGLTAIFYVVVFILWVAWTRYGGSEAATPVVSTPSPAEA